MIRLDLDSYESSKERMREIEAVVAEAEEFRPDTPPKRGRPKGGDREAARRLGIDRETVSTTRRHVETADEYPALQGNISTN